MAQRITDSQRTQVLELLAQGVDREAIAAQVGITPGQVSAVTAHVKMGTYKKHEAHETIGGFTSPDARERTHTLLKEVSVTNREANGALHSNRLLIGTDTEANKAVCWILP